MDLATSTQKKNRFEIPLLVAVLRTKFPKEQILVHKTTNLCIFERKPQTPTQLKRIEPEQIGFKKLNNQEQQIFSFYENRCVSRWRLPQVPNSNSKEVGINSNAKSKSNSMSKF